MTTHAPSNYACPFCAIVSGVEEAGVLTTQSEIVLRMDNVTAFISSHQWPNNPGHVLVVPNEHFENLYDLPDRYGEPLLRVARYVALAMKEAYRCHGTSTRQHNEPAGNQDVWHYHLHVFPRFQNDNLYKTDRQRAPLDIRLAQASLLKSVLGRHASVV